MNISTILINNTFSKEKISWRGKQFLNKQLKSKAIENDDWLNSYSLVTDGQSSCYKGSNWVYRRDYAKIAMLIME